MTDFTRGPAQAARTVSAARSIRTILDPATRTVTHLVIEPKHRKMDGPACPSSWSTRPVARSGSAAASAEFEQLEPAEEVDLAEGAGDGGGYGQAEAVQGYGNVGGMGVGASSSGMGIGMGLGHRTPTRPQSRRPAGRERVERHESVHAVDGEIGRVEGFVVDPADNKVTHVLLQEGHMWGRKEVAIPVSAVVSVDAGIRLNLTKKQVEDLPPLHPGHP